MPPPRRFRKPPASMDSWVSKLHCGLLTSARQGELVARMVADVTFEEEFIEMLKWYNALFRSERHRMELDPEYAAQIRERMAHDLAEWHQQQQKPV